MMQLEAGELHMTTDAVSPFSQRPNLEEDRPFLIFAANLLSKSPDVELSPWHSYRLNKLLTLQKVVVTLPPELNPV